MSCPRELDRLRWVACEACGGSGEIITRIGSIIASSHEEPYEHTELCSVCDGYGRDCVETEPVECDDDLAARGETT